MLPRLLMDAREASQTATTNALAALSQMMAEQARINSYQDCFIILAVVFLVALLPAWFTQAHTSPLPAAALPVASPPTQVAVLTLPAGEVWDEAASSSRPQHQTFVSPTGKP